MKCSRCKQDKPEDEFYRNNKRPRGRQSQCKSCDGARGRDPLVIAQRKAYAARHGRGFRLRRMYGVGEEWYNTKAEHQGDLCAICGTTDRPRYDQWFIDHNHATGTPRSLLCGNCNGGLGFFQDSPHLLAIAIAYLESHVEQTTAVAIGE